MIRASIDGVLTILVLAYLVVLLLSLVLDSVTPIALTPFIVVLVVCATKRLRVFLPLAIAALALSLPVLSTKGLYLSIPLSIAVPFLLKKSKPEENRQILGSTTIAVVRYMLLATPLILINMRIAVAIAFTSSTAILASIISYVRLSKVRVEAVYVPDMVALGGNSSAILKILAPLKCYIVISCDNTVNQLLARGLVIANIDLPSGHVGTNVIDVIVKTHDLWGFSGRIIGRYSITYKVIPISRRVIEVIEKEFKLYRELYGFTPSVDIAVLDLERGATAIARGREVVRVLSEVIQKTRAPYIVALLEHLKALVEELLTSGAGIQRKSRYGEYTGVRQYTPGDYLKHIHWKKSVSKGMLIVKEFSLSSPRELGGIESRSLEPLIIVDLYAANVFELDKITVSLLRLCLNIFRSNPELNLNTLLVLGTTAIVVKGRAVDILYKLYRFFKDAALRVMFSYEPAKYDEIAVEGVIKAEPKPKLISMYVASGNTYAKKILDLLLVEEVTPPRPFTILHSDALTLRYSVVKHILSNYGFVYTTPDVVVHITSTNKVTEHGSRGAR